MDTLLTLKIIGAVAALGLGLWLGLPGRYEPEHDEIEKTMTSGYGRTKRVKRHFTPMAWVKRNVDVGTRSKGGGGFKLEKPEDR